jgi:hypothetical protein
MVLVSNASLDGDGTGLYVGMPLTLATEDRIDNEPKLHRLSQNRGFPSEDDIHILL